MRKQIATWTAPAVLLAVGFHAGVSQTSRPVEIDADPWRSLDPDNRFDARHRARLKDELLRAKPTPRSFLEMQRETAYKALIARMTRPPLGKAERSDFGLSAQESLLAADLALCRTDAERLTILEWHWTFLSALEFCEQARYDAGVRGPANFYPIVCARLYVEYELLKAMQK